MDFANKTENVDVSLPEEVLEVLESQFNKVKTLHSTDLEIIAAELGVRDVDVKVNYYYFLVLINYELLSIEKTKVYTLLKIY